MSFKRVVVVLLGLLLIAGIAFGVWRYRIHQLILKDLQDIPAEFDPSRPPIDLVPIDGVVQAYANGTLTIDVQVSTVVGQERFVGTKPISFKLPSQPTIVRLPPAEWDPKASPSIGEYGPADERDPTAAEIVRPDHLKIGDHVAVYVSASAPQGEPATAYRIEILP